MLAILMLFISGIQDPDFWWHLRVGRWIVDNGKLPSHDLFTYTVPDHVWTDHEYLTEILMWLTYSVAGTAVTITITKKPFVVPMSAIQSELKKAFGANP